MKIYRQHMHRYFSAFPERKPPLPWTRLIILFARVTQYGLRRLNHGKSVIASPIGLLGNSDSVREVTGPKRLAKVSSVSHGRKSVEMGRRH